MYGLRISLLLFYVGDGEDLHIHVLDMRAAELQQALETDIH